MKVLGRFGWAVALVMVLSTGIAVGQEWSCPYEHDYFCADGEYECCCPKGIRCLANSNQCDLWCSGQWNGASTSSQGSQEDFLKSLTPSAPAPAGLCG